MTIKEVHEEMKVLGGPASFFYTLACIFSFGAVWLFKVIIQKAILDAWRIR